MRVLTIRTKTKGREILMLGSDGRSTWIISASALVRPDAERWLTRGYTELVRDADGIGLSQRVTKQDEPLFLDRIAASMKRQFKFDVAIEEERS